MTEIAEIEPPRSVWRPARGALPPYFGVLAALLGTIAVLSWREPVFGTRANLVNILETNATLCVVAVGLTFVLIAGGFDLSVGSMVAIAAIAMGKLLVADVPAPVAILIVSLSGALVGSSSGLMIAKGRLSFFVVTLAMASILRGLASLWSDGKTLTLYDYDWIRSFGSGRVGGIPWPVISALCVAVAGALILRYTGFGRMVYAVGGNAEAARIAGLNVSAVRILVYAIAGLLAAFASTIEVGRLASASPSQGIGIELTAGAAVLLGGTSFAGGSGSVVGTVVGVLFLGVVSNGLSVAGVSPFWQGIVSGGVLLAAAALDRLRG
jgi:ribose transport system permease protein